MTRPKPELNELDRAMKALTPARKFVFFTGAGISAKRGIPTFREKLAGFWERHDPERLETLQVLRTTST